MIIYLGSFYIILGFLFLFIPLIYLELGRPNDFIRAAVKLIIGLTLILKNKAFGNSFFLIYLLFTLLVVLYLFEIFLSRWNQLTDKEKSKLLTLVEFNKNFSKTLEALFLGLNNIKNALNFLNFERNNQIISKKKWVRPEKNDSIKSGNPID